ncbi:helix-turn-helix transcriptional regulator [Spongiactinospora rosea]|uniref:helix-turn-helix transcriptional regulator n=1 Tax=Spongiactinospora rosea TaxID=2248750 RepID=UPI001CEDC35B|nr:helix-turn-helix transcriptional regulator [Spongiactinospora rosea]
MSSKNLRVQRRGELATFLRSRRERITPDDVGLAPGIRRRTPGLRREEVALLAGVGVTWYTWLEQGRPINPSVAVLDAIAGTLRLSHAEREHLYRLAGVPVLPAAEEHGMLDPQVQLILDTLNPLAAAVYSSRFDLLAWNGTFTGLFPAFVAAAPERRNAIWEHFTSPPCCNPFVDPHAEVRPLVAMLRAAFGRHLAEPAWTGFVRLLSAESSAFARMWSAHDVAEPGPHVKVLRYEEVGEIRLTTTTLTVVGMPEARLVVYTPAGEASRQRLARLAARPSRHCSLPEHRHTRLGTRTEADGGLGGIGSALGTAGG